MKYLIFELSMSGVNSWDGKWTGQENYHAIGKKFSEKSEIANIILKKKYYSYDFGDGWCAGIHIKKVGSKEYGKMIKKAEGFQGYGWMVNSIIMYNKIKIK